MNEKIKRAIYALNKYDYEMGKSAHEAVWLIEEMRNIFESEDEDKKVECDHVEHARKAIQSWPDWKKAPYYQLLRNLE